MKRNLIFIILMIVCCLVSIVGSVFGWIIYSRRNIIVYTGNVKIAVTGYYDIIADEETPLYDNPLTALNNFNDLASSDVIAYKFVVENQTVYPAVLSIAYSDFSRVIFSQFEDFHTFCVDYKTTNGVLPTTANYTTEFRDTIVALATINTAKLTLVVEEAYYVKEDGQTVTIADADRYLWKYCTGTSFLTDISLEGSETITVYYKVKNQQLSNLIATYRDWLIGNVSTVSYGQETCANMLGYSYDALSNDDKSIVDSYLTFFYEKELEAALPDAEELAILKLDLEYMRFTAESPIIP